MDSAAGCFTYDTKVKLADGRDLEIGKIVDEFNKGKTNYVYSSTKDREISIQPIVDAFKTKTVKEFLKLTLNNGKIINCTPDHKFMLKDGSYKQAQYLSKDDSLMSLQFKKLTKYKENHNTEQEQPKWKSLLKYFGSYKRILNRINTCNRKIVKMELIKEIVDVYDITVPPYNNFALSAGIFVHNSAKQGRFREFQAILPLKGKVLNTEKADFDKMINSEAIKNIIAALGAGVGDKFDITKCRYDKVVIMCFTGDTKVKLLNGTTPTFEELVEMEKQNPGQDYWVYSRDKDGNIVPGRGYKPRITGYRNELVELTFDNGYKVKCTPDHKFMLKNGIYKEAKDLDCNDSLSPLYTKINNGHKFFSEGREMIFNDKSDKWEFTHHWVNGYPEKGYHTHHKDFNYLNNDPSNLEFLSKKEHMKLHMIDKNNNNNKLIKNRAIASKEHLKKYNQSEDKIKRNKELHKKGVYKHIYFGNNGYNGSEKQKEDIRKSYENNPWRSELSSRIITEYNKSELNKETTRKMNRDENIKKLQLRGKLLASTMRLMNNKLDINLTNIENSTSIATEKGIIRPPMIKPTIENINKHFESYEDFYLSLKERCNKHSINIEVEDYIEKSKLFNHKIVSKKFIELDNPIPVYCMTVEDHHNFTIDLGDGTGVQVKNCDADEDGFHIKALLLTFFYNYMRPLFDNDMVYVTIPPLYRVSKGKQNIYLKDDRELKEYREKNKGKLDIQRFKGLTSSLALTPFTA